eukprot:2069272-Rhodomonas_salina.1
MGQGEELPPSTLPVEIGASGGGGPAAAGPALAVDGLVDTGQVQFADKGHSWNKTNNAIREQFLPRFVARLHTAYTQLKRLEESGSKVHELFDFVVSAFNEFTGNIDLAVNGFERTNTLPTGDFFYFKVLTQCQSFLRSVQKKIGQEVQYMTAFLGDVKSILSKIDGLIQVFDSSVPELERSTLKATGKMELQKLRNYIEWVGCLFFYLDVIPKKDSGAGQVFETYKDTFYERRKSLEELLSEND